MAMNNHFVREDLAIPLRHDGGFALTAEEEDGEDPSERHVMNRPTARRQSHGLVGLLMPFRRHLHREGRDALRNHPHVKPWCVSKATMFVAQGHMAVKNP